MSIWIYLDSAPQPSRDDVQRHLCLFCGDKLDELFGPGDRNHWSALRVCPTCGWWCKHHGRKSQGVGGEYFDLSGACAQLKNLDITDMGIPIDEIRQYLIGRYEDRFYIHPRSFEETVASVFSSCGYVVHVTSYQSDGGIDVVLNDPCGSTVGVQVKRYRDKIQVEQIRSFAGALVLNGYTKGIFVTTSSYTSGAEEASTIYKTRGLPIELVDAYRFYGALHLSQRERYKNLSEWSQEIRDVKEQIIYEDEGPTYLFM